MTRVDRTAKERVYHTRPSVQWSRQALHLRFQVGPNQAILSRDVASAPRERLRSATLF